MMMYFKMQTILKKPVIKVLFCVNTECERKNVQAGCIFKNNTDKTVLTQLRPMLGIRLRIFSPFRIQIWSLDSRGGCCPKVCVAPTPSWGDRKHHRTLTTECVNRCDRDFFVAPWLQLVTAGQVT